MSGVLRNTTAAFLATCICAAGAVAQDLTGSVGEAFSRFEERCMLMLADPDAYVASVLEMEQPDRITSRSDDERIVMITDATLPLMEMAEFAQVSGVEQRYCYIALLEERALASKTALNEAFLSFMEDRDDLSLIGGRMTASEAELALHAGTENEFSVLMAIDNYYIEGLTPEDGTVVKAIIQGGSFEIQAHRIVQR